MTGACPPWPLGDLYIPPPPTNYNPSTTSLLIDADKYRGEQAPVTLYGMNPLSLWDGI